MSDTGLPSGGSIFTSLPDVLFIPEFVFGGLVWTLIASTRVEAPNPLGWVMFVSIFCFIVTTLWFFIFLTGKNKSGIWPSLDVGYHATAALFYLSASVLLANFIIPLTGLTLAGEVLRIYQIFIAAVVMAFFTTLLYCIHAVLSAFRWRSS
ncbi:Myelin and lymphocyte protein T-lymphocyte maturation-associated protein [Triplophysa tibetana]|uniref:Myelin and lymphocyte protein n=1 Tax=Triplophysa tibetana TaxID=1572043 RepID=A0A5A9NQ32_9TELE|nr:Myelin and lymphocyte protein T-lymphocyte maturation-associated protein [Triplophysa tibetana]